MIRDRLNLDIEVADTTTALECPGCGCDIDPRDKYRGSVTEDGYCSLFCWMENGGSR